MHIPVPTANAPPVASGQSQSIDWHAQADALALRYAQESAKPGTFSSPPRLRQPCRPRTDYDKTTREIMTELSPPPVDPIPLGGFRSSAVNMGGVIVHERPMKGGGGDRRDGGGSGRKSSFKWVWEYRTHGSPPHDGLFDDMQAAKTPESSVPHHEVCD